MASHQAAYEFGQFTLVPSQKRLLSDREPVPLGPKVFDTLVLLVENQGRLIQKEEFFKALWPNSIVEEQALAHNISQLRKVLRDPAEEPQFIETVPKRGYRFIAPVRKSGEPPAVLAAPAPSGATPAATQPQPRPRRSLLGTLAAVLVLAAVYVYYSGTGRDAGGVLPAIHSLAVLPLENLSGDKEQEYFAEGMTDALTTDLAQIGSLRVISRTSAMQFKGSGKSLPQIGRDLKVDAVVEGTVARAEGRVRITAQLVEASSDRHLWAKSYERDLKDILALQDEIAKDVAEQVRVKLTPGERTVVAQTHPVDPEAYDAYLRGSYWMNQLTPEGHKKGCDYFHRVIAKDPGYAPAYVAVADCVPSWADKRHAIEKALALDPSLAFAHSWLAVIKFLIDWDWPGADAEHKRAIALNPNDPRVRFAYSYYLVAMGRLEEAMKEAELARDLNPYWAGSVLWLAQVFYHARRYDEALRVEQLGLEMHPDSDRFYWDMADIYEQKKMFAEAFAARQQSLTIRKDPTVPALGEAYERGGYKGYLLKLAEFWQTRHIAYAAHCYALAGDDDRAIAIVEAAYDAHSANPGSSGSEYILFIRTAPEFDSIRSSPRVRDVIRRIGFPQSPGEKN